jgi:hypothetical protein
MEGRREGLTEALTSSIDDDDDDDDDDVFPPVYLLTRVHTMKAQARLTGRRRSCRCRRRREGDPLLSS